MKIFNKIKTWQFCLIWIVISLIVAIISLAMGRYSQISFKDVLNCLYDFIFYSDKINSSNRNYNVVLYIRFPRTVASLVIGASLACAGVAYQALFSNPIASPDTLGVTQGSAFGAVIGILFGFSSVLMKISSFAMGCVVVAIVFILANTLSRGRNVTFYLLLIGMVATSFFQSMVSFVKYTADADQKLPQITYWLLGSLSKVALDDLIPLILFFVIGIIPLLCVSWRMNLLVLSPEEAEAMGVNIKQLRLVIVAFATMLTAVATSMSGCISWFGLIVPHLMRKIVGNDMKKLVPVSACVGACMLLVTDIVARCISNQELPISVITSIIGAPLVIFILFKDWRRAKWN